MLPQINALLLVSSLGVAKQICTMCVFCVICIIISEHHCTKIGWLASEFDVQASTCVSVS